MEAMRNEQDLQQAVPENVGIVNFPEFLREQAEHLSVYGGFGLVESTIDGASSLNPDYPARNSIFLTDARKQAEREELLQSLTQWAEVLEQGDDIRSMVDHCVEQAEHCTQILRQDLAKAVDASVELERSYRNAAFFFRNCEVDRVWNVSFINCSAGQLKDLEDTRFSDAIAAELNRHYDRLDLRNNYSILVLPGYLGSNSLVEKLAKIAFDNKVMLITDFEHLDEPDDIMEMFARSGLASGDIFKSNVIMTCNWLIGRGKLSELGEESDLYVPPSGALAGKIYSTLMSQVTAGKRFGVLSGVDGVKFDLKKTEIANLEKMGLVPMARDYGKVMAFSAKTLFNGDNLGLQTYSVVRVFDYVTKVLIDFLNRRAFENFNSNTRKELMNQIVTFMDSVTGPGKLIEDFTIRRFEQDSVQKDRIHLDIHMKPYFPAKNFLIKMEGQKSDDGNHWGTAYEQDK
jgi:hypothetical protein